MLGSVRKEHLENNTNEYTESMARQYVYVFSEILSIFVYVCFYVCMYACM